MTEKEKRIEEIRLAGELEKVRDGAIELVGKVDTIINRLLLHEDKTEPHT